MNFKFPKSEKLSSEKEIALLFGSKYKFVNYPFKVQWSKNDRSTNQLLIACPKRSFKKAVDRNLIKRRMREAYRLNKNALNLYCEETSKHFNIAFVFIGNEILDSNVIHSKFQEAIDKLIQELKNHE